MDRFLKTCEELTRALETCVLRVTWLRSIASKAFSLVWWCNTRCIGKSGCGEEKGALVTRRLVNYNYVRLDRCEV